MASSILDFKLDFKNTLRQDFYNLTALSKHYANINMTGVVDTGGRPSGRRKVFVVAANERMSLWAANELGIERQDVVLVSTSNGWGEQAVAGWDLTMDDLVFAPGYRTGRYHHEVERALAARVPDYPHGIVIDFEDDRDKDYA